MLELVNVQTQSRSILRKAKYGTGIAILLPKHESDTYSGDSQVPQRNRISLNNVGFQHPFSPQSLKFRNTGFPKLTFKQVSWQHFQCVSPSPPQERERKMGSWGGAPLPHRRCLHSLGDTRSAPPGWPGPGQWHLGWLCPERQTPTCRRKGHYLTRTLAHGPSLLEEDKFPHKRLNSDQMAMWFS